jgi:hypothetical protein
VFLDRTVCFCSTMNRIDLPHLVWSLESLVEGASSTGSRSTPTSPATPAGPGPHARAAVTSRCARRRAPRAVERGTRADQRRPPAPGQGPPHAQAQREGQAPLRPGRPSPAHPQGGGQRRKQELKDARGTARARSAPATSGTWSSATPGPVRRLVRDTVDGRRNAGVLVLPWRCCSWWRASCPSRSCRPS